MCKEVSVHLQQRPPLQDKCGQDHLRERKERKQSARERRRETGGQTESFYLGEIHAQPHLGQQVHDYTLVLLHRLPMILCLVIMAVKLI